MSTCQCLPRTISLLSSRAHGSESFQDLLDTSQALGTCGEDHSAFPDEAIKQQNTPVIRVIYLKSGTYETKANHFSAVSARHRTTLHHGCGRTGWPCVMLETTTSGEHFRSRFHAALTRAKLQIKEIVKASSIHRAARLALWIRCHAGTS